MFYEDMKQS